MNNYAVYYNYKENKNDLFILLKNKKHDEILSFDNVDVYLNNKGIIMYVIHNINAFIKIYSSGIIHLPPLELINLINILLKKHSLKTLEYKTKSGFVIGEVINNKCIDIGDKVVEISTDLNLGSYVVVAIPHTFLSKDLYLDEYHICSYKDLNIDDSEQLFVIDDKCNIGEDFYLWEAK